MKSNSLFFSIVILLCGLIIAGSIFFARNDFFRAKPVEENKVMNKVEISPVSSSDHILGNPQADVFLVEYFDFECPYCKDFHQTMKRIVSDFAEGGKFAWVMRHFPLDKHTQAKISAIYSECVFEQLGDKGFWDFADTVFENSPESLKEDNLKSISVNMGADEKKLAECVKTNPRKDKIEKDYNEGLKIHSFDPNFGTPYNILVAKTGEQVSMPGSQMYINLKTAIKALIK